MSESTETTPAVKLRSSVVLLVIRSIVGLCVALLIIIAILVLTHRDVPGEMWLAFGNLSGALITLLVNSKHSQDGPVPVVGEGGGAVITKDSSEVDPNVPPDEGDDGAQEPKLVTTRRAQRRNGNTP